MGRGLAHAWPLVYMWSGCYAWAELPDCKMQIMALPCWHGFCGFLKLSRDKSQTSNVTCDVLLHILSTGIEPLFHYSEKDDTDKKKNELKAKKKALLIIRKKNGVWPEFCKVIPAHTKATTLNLILHIINKLLTACPPHCLLKAINIFLVQLPKLWEGATHCMYFCNS